MEVFCNIKKGISGYKESNHVHGVRISIRLILDTLLVGKGVIHRVKKNN